MTAVATPEDDTHVADLYGTFHSYALNSRDGTYTVKFVIDIDQAAEVIALNRVMQKIITLRVEKRRRRGRVHQYARVSFGGSDDD